MKTPIRGIRIPDDEWQAAQETAEAEGKSVSEIVRALLAGWVAGRYVIAALLVALVATLLPLASAALAEAGEPECVPNDTPEPAVTTVYYAPETITASVERIAADAESFAQDRLHRAGGQAWRWTCEVEHVQTSGDAEHYYEIRRDVLDALAPHGPRRYAVLANVAGWSCGAGSPLEDDHGRAVGVHFIAFAHCWHERPDTTLHELLHTFGAVHRDSPTAAPGRHSSVAGDVMASARDRRMKICEPQGITAAIDCLGDSYYSLSPSGWLADHPEWNVALSDFVTPEAQVSFDEHVDGHGGGPTGVDRIGGADRFETAALIAAEAYPNGADVVYVASGHDYPDALAGSAFTDGPILLVRQSSIPEATASALDRLAPRRIRILGGPAAVSDDVASALARWAGGS